MMVAAMLCPDWTMLLLVVRPVAAHLPEIASGDLHPELLGTVPDTVTVIEAVAPLWSEKRLQVIV